MSRLHIFDMDGTLMSGSACLEISRRMGTLEAVLEMEERWSKGLLDHHQYWIDLLPLWEGLTDEDIDHAFAGSTWMHGIAEVWHDIAERGEHSAVISMSPGFFVERLVAWGLGTAHGARVSVGDAPDRALTVTPESKVEIALELTGRYGLTLEECVAYGDSASDVPLFRTLERTVAVNGSDALREIAAVAYDGRDMREAYAAGRALFA